MAGTKFDPKTRTTVRNLRIREDTAKYLYNLDPNSAFYDPKTRSMRENPFKNNSKDPAQYVHQCTVVGVVSLVLCYEQAAMASLSLSPGPNMQETTLCARLVSSRILPRHRVSVLFFLSFVLL